MSWNDIAKRKQEDRARTNADASRAEAWRAQLHFRLPGIFASIVDGIAIEVEAYNAELPLKADGITVTRTATTARFEKVSSPPASLVLTLSGPATVAKEHYAATITAQTIGLNANQERTVEDREYEISLNELGPRYMRRGQDGAYSDLIGEKRLVDDIITPLVYFVS